MALVSLDQFNLLKKRVLERKRIAGIYILEAAIVPEGAAPDSFLRDFAAGFGFGEPDVGDLEWKHAEHFREEARLRLVEVLVGGSEIGHSVWDIPPPEAQAISTQFVSFFGDDARFFCDRPLAGEAQCLAPYNREDVRDYIFDGGCIAVDSKLAAIFWVLDND